MHDIRAIRETPDILDAALARRGADPMSSEVLALDSARRAKIAAAETAQAEQNAASKQVGAAKAAGNEAAPGDPLADEEIHGRPAALMGPQAARHALIPKRMAQPGGLSKSRPRTQGTSGASYGARANW